MDERTGAAAFTVELVDALSYSETQEGQEAAVARELAQEMRSSPAPLAALPELSARFADSVFLATEFQRLQSGRPSLAVGSKRAAVSAPAAQNDAGAWEKALTQLKAELGYQHSKLLDLQLLQKYGKDAWIQFNQDLVRDKEFLERELVTP